MNKEAEQKINRKLIYNDPSSNMRLGRMIRACWAELVCTNVYGETGLTGTWKLMDPLPVLMLPDSTVAKVSAAHIYAVQFLANSFPHIFNYSQTLSQQH
jgi:hypothetical protein